MSAGPLRRSAATLGLLALVPTALLLLGDAITLQEAALRAGATLLLVVLLGRVAGHLLEFLAATVEQAEVGGGEGPTAPRRRSTDRPSPEARA